jgi:ABC-type uncharacterized transport system ATPase subunit
MRAAGGMVLAEPACSAGCPMKARDRDRSFVGMNRSSATAVHVDGLTKLFGARRALDVLDLEVPGGVTFGLLGPNGAGKTTIIRLLLGLAWPTSGSMSVLGQPVGERRSALARVGAIVEEPRFHPHLTGRENLEVSAAAPRYRALPARGSPVADPRRADERT